MYFMVVIHHSNSYFKENNPRVKKITINFQSECDKYLAHSRNFFHTNTR